MEDIKIRKRERRKQDSVPEILLKTKLAREIRCQDVVTQREDSEWSGLGEAGIKLTRAGASKKKKVYFPSSDPQYKAKLSS